MLFKLADIFSKYPHKICRLKDTVLYEEFVAIYR